MQFILLLIAIEDFGFVITFPSLTSKICITFKMLSRHRRQFFTILIIMYCVSECVHLWYTELLKPGKYTRHIHGITSYSEHHSTWCEGHIIPISNNSV
jgi:hypothetical protein